jgi:hypothetical protein
MTTMTRWSKIEFLNEQEKNGWNVDKCLTKIMQDDFKSSFIEFQTVFGQFNLKNVLI